MSRYRKFAVAAAGAVGAIVSLNVASGTVQAWLVAGLAVATAAGVYEVKNAPPKPSASPTASATGTGT